MPLTRVELVERDAELAEAWDELGLDLAVDGIVDALVRRGLDVPVRSADLHDLRDFPTACMRGRARSGDQMGDENKDVVGATHAM